jgi:TctA family transporter
MWIGNLMLLVLNLPLIGLWVRVIAIPYHFLFPIIILFCAIGYFAVISTPSVTPSACPGATVRQKARSTD